LRLFINDIEFDLPNNFTIARTKQVNDMGSISDRQTNYTQKIKLPRTKNNQNGLNQLGFIGSQSTIPYENNTVKLYNENGEAEIYDGYAKVFGTTDKYYDVAIYDGYVTFAKAIENLTLNALDLEDVNHFKTLDNVIDSFNDLTIYKYIVADYNGKALYDTDVINIDYLVPSLPISYLWDKIFDTFGFTYEGVVFDSFNFTNLWLTYPKGVSEEEPVPELIYTEDDFSGVVDGNNDVNKILVHTAPAPTKGIFINGDTQYLVPDDGTYIFNANNINIFVVGILEFSGGFPIPDNLDYSIAVILNDSYFDTYEIYNSVSNSYTERYIDLNEGDLISIAILPIGVRVDDVIINSAGVTFEFLAGQNIDFNDTFLDFKIKDFIDEILNRFSLTPNKDKYSNNIVFKTLSEIIQVEADDWSADKNKFVGLTNESYIYRNYAQVNNFKYKYNDKEGDYNDSFLLIDNYNLNDNATVFSSQIYSPEKEISTVLPKDTNIYKLWDKEIKDDDTVTYKDLNKRFYFMRYRDFLFTSQQSIGSPILQTERFVTTAPFESFFKLKFSDIIAEYYDNMSLILNDSKIVKADIFLTEADINELDFSKMKYIKELGNYYLLNKVSNFKGSGVVSCELIRVKYV